MNKRKPRFLAFLQLFLLVLAVDAARPFGHESSDLTADPGATFGVLDNGLRYAVLPHAEPPGRVSLRLLVEAGWLDEADDKIGVAHFLEHLMFNGSRHFPPGELIKLFQRLGMGFGADTNAYTTFDETVYMFELPDTDAETLDQSFKGIRDYADGAFLLEEEIERERGIILAERRDRDSASRRSAEDALRFAMPYARIADRINATIDHTLAIERSDLLTFYQQHYSAERLAVVVVGDIDPERAVGLIEEHFADVRANAEPQPQMPTGDIYPRGEAYHVYVDAELSGTEIDLSSVSRHEKGPDTAAKRAQQLARSAAVSMLNRRLAKLARSEAPPFLSAQAYAYDFLRFADIAGIQSNVSDPDSWATALAAIQTELRRALEHGFTATELEVFKANQQAELVRASSQAASRDSRQLAQTVVDAIRGDVVLQHPAQRQALYEPLLAALTPEIAHAALVDAWSDPSRLLRIETPEAIDNLYAEMRRAYRSNDALEVAAFVEEAVGAFAYTDFGPAGEVLDRYSLDDLGAEQIVFANNVVLSLKKTDFEQQRIRVGVRVGAGKLSLAPNQAGLDIMAGFAFGRGGLEAHSVDDLQQILAGRIVGSDFGVDEDAFVLSGTTTPEDLELQLQLLAAYITAPGYREEGARQFAQAIPQYFRYLTSTLDGAYARSVPRWLASGDPRFGFPEQEILAGYTLNDVRDWLSPALVREKLEIAIVGDIDPEAVVEAVRLTFGALPKRQMVKNAYEDARRIKLPASGAQGIFTYETENPKSRLVTFWPTTDRADIGVTRRLSIMAGIVGERLRERVREEIGEAYSPYAYNTSSEVYTGYGYTAAVIDTAPESLDLLSKVIREIANQIIEEGFDEDEFQRVLRPRISSLEQQARDNGYWLNSVLLGSHENPAQLDWARTLFTDYPSIQREEILRLATEFLPPERIFEVRVMGEVAADAPVSE
jgi:zinc protease